MFDDDLPVLPVIGLIWLIFVGVTLYERTNREVNDAWVRSYVEHKRISELAVEEYVQTHPLKGWRTRSEERGRWWRWYKRQLVKAKLCKPRPTGLEQCATGPYQKEVTQVLADGGCIQGDDMDWLCHCAGTKHEYRLPNGQIVCVIKK